MDYVNGQIISLGDKLRVRLRDASLEEERVGIVLSLMPILLYLDRPFGTSHNAAWENFEIANYAISLGLPRVHDVCWWVTIDTTILQNLSIDVQKECFVCKRKVFLSEKKCWWCDHPISP